MARGFSCRRGLNSSRPLPGSVVSLVRSASRGAARTPMTPDRRLYARRYAQMRRDKKLAARMVGAVVCPKRYGPGICGGKLHTITDDIGRSHIVCEWCERKRRGLCRECSQPVRGRSLRCEAHKEVARARQVEASKDRHRDEVNARARAAYQGNPAVRERRNAYKREWRRANPEKVKAYKRAEALRQNKNRARYHERWRKRHRIHLREVARARYYALHPRRPAPVCAKCGKDVPYGGTGRPPKRCDRCVPPCIRKLRRKARREAAKRAAAIGPERGRLRRPPVVLALGDGTHRCLGVGCAERLTGRVKKCGRCKRVGNRIVVGVAA